MICKKYPFMMWIGNSPGRGQGMTDKICPFMSRPSVAYVNDEGIAKFQFAPVCCQKERCMAWDTRSYEAWLDNKQQQVTESGCRLIP